VSGEVNATDRENIREITEQEKNAIIVASTGTFSTGINIKNLHQIIFASPTKSQIRVLQSIGRGLRKSDNGNRTTVYDISDNFSWKKKKNYTMTHAIERIKIYAKEQFDYKIYEINLQ
jgi:superfamily II DNA or RNA helicase